MNSIVVTRKPYWEMVRVLYQFEGTRCLWRVPVSGVLFAAAPLLLVVVAVAAAAIAGDDFALLPGVVAAIVGVVGTSYVHPRMARREFHRKIVADRLWTWEKPNPATHLEILVRDGDVGEVQRVLRRAGFNPGAFVAPLGSPPADAPDVSVRVGVEEPQAHIQSASDTVRKDRIASTLDAVGLRARVAGLDVPSEHERAVRARRR